MDQTCSSTSYRCSISLGSGEFGGTNLIIIPLEVEEFPYAFIGFGGNSRMEI